MSDGAGGEVSGAVQRAVTCMSMERRVRSGEGGGGAGGYNQALAITCAAEASSSGETQFLQASG